MTSAPINPILAGCRRCGLVQRVAPVPERHRALCPRCGAVVREALGDRGPGAGAAALALAALILFVPALLLPVMRLEKFGHVRTATIWTGARDLVADGQVAIGLLVFVCSILIPIAKLVATLALGAGLVTGRAGMLTHAGLEWLGRWGMLDVLLVAVLVATVKLGDYADVSAGPGAGAFAAVVVLSLLASARLDPHALWAGETA
ncbi:MAG TPA: paraquat-inducible protein A [Phycisphaerales bacterium]|nr:paraquat-inducible protein A [Phycisphaerales bacterium]